MLLAQNLTDRKKYEDALLKEKERAEFLSRAKDDFLSVISHELRTPLNPIIGYVEMLKRQGLDSIDKELGLIQDSANHLLALINDILDYTRIENGSISLENQWIDYRKLCQGVVELLQQGALEKGLRLGYSDCSEAEVGEKVFVKLDHLRIKQVLFNLVSNAVKFTEAGSIEVRSRLNMKSEEMAVLRIDIEDTGIGIDSRTGDTVFDPFSQVDTSLSREYDGLGLGLSISKRIVVAMEGKIGYTSVLGKGSCFWVEIPTRVSAYPDTSYEIESGNSKLPLTRSFRLRLRSYRYYTSRERSRISR